MPGSNDKKLVKSILEGLVQQLVADAEHGEGEWRLYAMEIGVGIAEEPVNFHNPPAEVEVFQDNITGALFDPVKVKVARQEEVDLVHGFWEYRDQAPLAGNS